MSDSGSVAQGGLVSFYFSERNKPRAGSLFLLRFLVSGCRIK